MQLTIAGVLHTDPSTERLQEWKAQCLSKFPDKKQYKIILADPPWRYKSQGASIRGKTPYPTMSMKELQALPVSSIAAPTCVLLLWATCPLLPEALDLIKAWGFTYKTVFKVWLKRTSSGKASLGPGWWTRPSVELLLCATKGDGALNWKQTCSEPQEHPSLRKRHSQKPEELRDIIANFMSVDSRIELFARTVCPEYDAWGLEIPSFFHSSS
jgi:N6-adenosine-specific RNA methylase IME4